METDRFRAMNTEIVLAAEGDSRRISQGFGRVRQFIAEEEARFTRFSDASELSALNRAAGSWFQASSEMFEVIRIARDLHEQTGGLFDPALLDALRSIGYDRSMDEIRKFGNVPPSAGFFPRPGAGLRGLLLDDRTCRVWLPESVRLDLGGVAKGWIAQKAAENLADFSQACTVNAGGDLFLIGSPRGDGTWRIGLENPLEPGQDLAVLRVPDGAVATSSITRRRWMQGDQARHHILDPRTGLPARTDWLSVTVLAPQAATAEAFAKACLIAGTQSATLLLSRLPGITLIGVRNDGTLWGSDHSKDFIEHANANAQPVAL